MPIKTSNHISKKGLGTGKIPDTVKTPIYRRLWEHGKCGGKSVAALSGFSISESICLPIWPENTVRTNKYALNGLIIILA